MADCTPYSNVLYLTGERIDQSATRSKKTRGFPTLFSFIIFCHSSRFVFYGEWLTVINSIVNFNCSVQDETSPEIEKCRKMCRGMWKSWITKRAEQEK